MRKFVFTLRLFILSILLSSLIIAKSGFANSFNIKDLYLKNEKSFQVYINENANISIYYEPQYKTLARDLKDRVREIHYIYEKLLGSPKDFNLTIKLINQDKFFNITKVPNWINAIYFKKHIIFPIDDNISNNKKIDIEFLKSLRHEYMHAFIYNLSHGNCASWFDEGLAQWAEGNTNPRLWEELENFLNKHNALSLSNLERNYTTMPTYLVPVAYAESLFSVKYLIKNSDIENFKKLFSLLNKGYAFNESFKCAFSESIENFDNKISNILYSWKISSKSNLNSKNFDEFINFSTENNFETIRAKIKLR